MSVHIHLPTYQQDFSLSRHFIQTDLPGSLFAEALETDPTTPEITLTNPIITPDIIQFLVDYSQGKEPAMHNPNLVIGYKYLNIPWMLYYIDPMYDEIDKSNMETLANRRLLDRAIRENRVLVVGYFIVKGFPVTESMLELAVKSGAVDVVKILLPRLQEVNRRHLLDLAVLAQSLPIIDLLLQTPIEVIYEWLHAAVMLNRPDILDRLLKVASAQKSIFADSVSAYLSYGGMLKDLLSLAVDAERPNIVDYLLSQTDVNPSQDENDPLLSALNEHNMEIALRIMAAPRFDPNSNLDQILAAEEGPTPIVEALLQNPKTRLTRDLLETIIHQVEGEINYALNGGHDVKERSRLLQRLNQELQRIPQ